MTLKELIPENIYTRRGTAVFQLGAQTMQVSGGKCKNTAFGNILGSRMSNALGRSNDEKRIAPNLSAGRKNTDNVCNNTDGKPRYLSFREAENTSASESSVKRKTKYTEGIHNQLKTVDEVSEKNEPQNQIPNNMLIIFAQVLELDTGDLLKLLKEAGVASEFLSKLQNTDENAFKLTQLLGLNSQQQDTLVKLLDFMTGTPDSLTTVQTEADVLDVLHKGTKFAVSSTETSKNQLTQEALSAFESMAAKLSLKIKIVLNNLGNMLTSDQSAFAAELKQLLQPLTQPMAQTRMEMAEAVIQVPAQQVAGLNINNTAVQTSAVVGVEAEAASGEEDGVDQEAKGKAEKEPLIRQHAAALKETLPHAAFPVVQTDITNGADTMQKTASSTQVAAKEIIGQVITQAKVILTPHKSEMIIDLKPDSLGKISLSVVTENGIVMAKFTADSQQVKQVLEANMQLLKDSLEKQGMTVQGFSVSVRQDLDRSAERWTQSKNNRLHANSGISFRTAGTDENLVDMLKASGRSDPHQWGYSTINLTA